METSRVRITCNDGDRTEVRRGREGGARSDLGVRAFPGLPYWETCGHRDRPQANCQPARSPGTSRASSQNPVIPTQTHEVQLHYLTHPWQRTVYSRHTLTLTCLSKLKSETDRQRINERHKHLHVVSMPASSTYMAQLREHLQEDSVCH